MFASLFSSKSSDKARDITAPEAMAALMVRIAKSDDEYSATEIARIDAVLGLLYQLTADQAADLRQTAEALEAEAPDTVRFTRAIKEEVPYEERFNVVRALWQVVYSFSQLLTRREQNQIPMRYIGSFWHELVKKH